MSSQRRRIERGQRRLRLLTVGFLLVSLLLLAGCKVELYTRLSENDANDMMAILLSNGISGLKLPEKKTGTFAIHVEQAQMPEAIALLKAHGFPKEKFDSIKDLFKKEGLISSPLEERVRFIYGLSQDVQETLARIDGVVTARVHIVLPENDPFADKVKPSSASVFIKYLPDSNLDDIKSEIKMIVEKSIEGLSYDKVSVVMLPARSATPLSQVTSWQQVFGLRMPSESATAFRVILVSIGLLALVLLGGYGYLGWLLWRRQGSNDAAAEMEIGPVSTEKTTWSAPLVNLVRRAPHG